MEVSPYKEAATTQMAWALSYVQGGLAEAWKDNLLDELAKGKLEVETAEQLFSKIRNNFREMLEKERKIEQLQTIEKGGRIYDKYVQEFKKVVKGSSYEGRPLIEEFKRGLNGAIKRKLAEAEELLSTIGEWQERVVRLDRNQRQSRVEERILERNTVCSGGNVQPRGEYGEGSYGGRGGNQLGPWRDPNAMDIDREREGDRMCYYCGKFGHMARNCWERNKARVVEMLQELAKENEGQ